MFSAIFVIRTAHGSMVHFERTSSRTERGNCTGRQATLCRPYVAYHFDWLQAPCHVITVETGRETADRRSSLGQQDTVRHGVVCFTGAGPRWSQCFVISRNESCSYPGMQRVLVNSVDITHPFTTLQRTEIISFTLVSLPVICSPWSENV